MEERRTCQKGRSSLEVARLIEGVLPPGVYQPRHWSWVKVWPVLSAQTRLSKLAFTGSTEVGRSIAHAIDDKLIPSTLETWREIREHSLPRLQMGHGNRRNSAWHPLQPGAGVLRWFQGVRARRHLR